MQNEQKELKCGEIRLHSICRGAANNSVRLDQVSLVWETMVPLDHKARACMACWELGLYPTGQ